MVKSTLASEAQSIGLTKKVDYSQNSFAIFKIFLHGLFFPPWSSMASMVLHGAPWCSMVLHGKKWDPKTHEDDVLYSHKCCAKLLYSYSITLISVPKITELSLVENHVD